MRVTQVHERGNVSHLKDGPYVPPRPGWLRPIVYRHSAEWLSKLEHLLCSEFITYCA